MRKSEADISRNEDMQRKAAGTTRNAVLKVRLLGTASHGRKHKFPPQAPLI